MIYSEEEFRKLIGEEAYKQVLKNRENKLNIQRLTQNNRKRLSEIAQKYKNFTMSEERINQILNAKNKDHLEVTRDEAEYLSLKLGIPIVDESFFK